MSGDTSALRPLDPKVQEVIGLIKTVQSENRNGRLEISDGSYITFMGGAPIHAVSGEATGYAAVDQILRSIVQGGTPEWKEQQNIEKIFTMNLSIYKITMSLRQLAREYQDNGKFATPTAVSTPPKAITPTPGKTSAPASPAIPTLESSYADELEPSTPNERPVKIPTQPPTKSAKAPEPDIKPTPKPTPKPTLPTAPERAISLPDMPPLPIGQSLSHGPSTLVAMIATLDEALISIVSESISGVVVIFDRRFQDALAVLDDGQRLTGMEALERLSLQSESTLTAQSLPAKIVRVLPDLWQLPLRISELPLAGVDFELLLKAFGQGLARSVAMVVTPDDTGVAFAESGEISFAYTMQNPHPADISLLAELAQHPQAVFYLYSGAAINTDGRPLRASEPAIAARKPILPKPKPPIAAEEIAAPAPTWEESEEKLEEPELFETPSPSPSQTLEHVRSQVLELAELLIGPYSSRVTELLGPAQTLDDLEELLGKLRVSPWRLVDPELLKQLAQEGELAIAKART